MQHKLSGKILVVDDDKIFRNRLAKSLTSRGLEALEADNISSALEIAIKHKPKRAVLDLKMANESGLDLIKPLKEAVPGIQTIVLTGFGSIPTAVETLRLGAANYLAKPADADQIIDAFLEIPSKNQTLEDAQNEHIHKVLSDHDGNISQASKTLGIHRRSLQRKLSKN